jgi:hypothetical protein
MISIVDKVSIRIVEYFHYKSQAKVGDWNPLAGEAGMAANQYLGVSSNLNVDLP